MSADIDQLAVENLACPACGAQPGDWCRTYQPYIHAPGRRAAWLHEARTHALREAWRIGYRGGEHMAYDSVVWRLQAAREGSWWALRDGVPVLDTDAIERWVASLKEKRR